MSPRPVRLQLHSATTGRPMLRAWPISDSVPQPPPMAIVTSPEATTATFRA